MPKKTLITLLLSVLLLFVMAATAAAAPSHRAVFTVGEYTYTVDGRSAVMDAAPFIKDNRAYVPVRYLALALGVPARNIIWSPSARTVTLAMDGVTVDMGIGGNIIYVNYKPWQIEVAPLIKDGRAYLPPTYIAVAFGYEVKWDGSKRAILIGPPGTLTQPDEDGRAKIVELVKRDFARRQSLPEADITVKKFEAADWPDTSLGCPEPGKMYAQVITPGYKITVTDGQVEATYHTDRRGNFVLCSFLKAFSSPAYASAPHRPAGQFRALQPTFLTHSLSSMMLAENLRLG
ncbi:MAG: copper amine oxidase N-terminal domain-containing protein [Bacillota bacterium]